MVGSNDHGGPGRPARGRDEPIDMWQCLAEAVPDILLLISRDGTILYVNRGAEGVPREAVRGTRVFDYVPAELRAEIRKSLAELFGGGSARVRQIPATHPDGTVRWYATHTGPVVQNGEVVAATIVARDVTEQRWAEAALRESEERNRTLVEHAPEAIVVFDADFERFVDANRNACVLFGMSREALLAADPVALSPPAQPDGRPSCDAARDRIEEALAGGTPAFEWTHRTPAGVDFRSEVRLVRLPAVGKRLIRGSITDISRQRELEEHLRQWQKLEALGQLAGGIAHDFNNLLTVISASANVLEDDLPPHDPLRLEVGWILGAANKGAVLTRQLLTFARRQDHEPGLVELNGIAEDAVVLLGRLLGAGIKLVKQLDPAGAPVRADRSQLEQVLMNLVLNARDAMPEGGTVTVSTTRMPGREWPEGARCRVKGPLVRLRVADTGVGMDEVLRRQIFTPFFTTKTEGRGTGLGLLIVQAVVKRCGGCLEVSSRPGAGSVFDVILPDAQAYSRAS